jgi:hypothetical protein
VDEIRSPESNFFRFERGWRFGDSLVLCLRNRSIRAGTRRPGPRQAAARLKAWQRKVEAEINERRSQMLSRKSSGLARESKTPLATDAYQPRPVCRSPLRRAAPLGERWRRPRPHGLVGGANLQRSLLALWIGRQLCYASIISWRK